MIDVDWFIKQSIDLIEQAEAAFSFLKYRHGRDYEETEQTFRIHLFAAWANWLNIRLMLQAKWIILSEDQLEKIDYIKLKFVQYARYLPEETDNPAFW